MEIGDKVKFTGYCSIEQQRWGNNDDPTGKLTIGSEYIISDIEMHSWHTKITVEGIEERFNSVCFDVV